MGFYHLQASVDREYRLLGCIEVNAGHGNRAGHFPAVAAAELPSDSRGQCHIQAPADGEGGKGKGYRMHAVLTIAMDPSPFLAAEKHVAKCRNGLLLFAIFFEWSFS